MVVRFVHWPRCSHNKLKAPAPLQHLTVLFGCVCSGSWRTAFQPEKTLLQEFHVDETTTVMAPLMTHTGQYHYLNDKVILDQQNFKKCMLLCWLICVFLYFTADLQL